MGAWITNQHDTGDIVYSGGAFTWRGGRYIQVDTRWDTLPGVPRELVAGVVFNIGPYRLRALRPHPLYASAWTCYRESGWAEAMAWRVRRWVRRLR